MACPLIFFKGAFLRYNSKLINTRMCIEDSCIYLKSRGIRTSSIIKIESAIANAVWICLLLHGVPMKSSVFHY